MRTVPSWLAKGDMVLLRVTAPPVSSVPVEMEDISDVSRLQAVYNFVASAALLFSVWYDRLGRQHSNASTRQQLGTPGHRSASIRAWMQRLACCEASNEACS